MVLGTLIFIAAGFKAVYTISIGSLSIPPMYAAFAAIIVNLLLAILLTPIFNGIGLKRGVDSTQPTDYDDEVELPEEVG
jgi:SSS family solute:Na+ symporter